MKDGIARILLRRDAPELYKLFVTLVIRDEMRQRVRDAISLMAKSIHHQHRHALSEKLIGSCPQQ